MIYELPDAHHRLYERNRWSRLPDRHLRQSFYASLWLRLFGPEITPDGRFIVFTSQEQGTNADGSVRLWDSQTQTNVLVSTNLSGVYSPNTLAQAPSLSPDGRFVVFLSTASDLTTNSVSAGFHVFQNDLSTGSITMLDVDTNGAGSTDFDGTYPTMSTNGQFIAFSGPCSLGAAGHQRRGRCLCAQHLRRRDGIDFSTQSLAAGPGTGDRYSAEGPLSISADGRWVAFSSYANDLFPGDTNNARDVFLCDRLSGSNLLVSVAANGGAALGGDSMQPVISTNGQYVFFASAATNLTTGNVYTSPPYYNIFRRDLLAQTTTLVSVSTNGVNAGNGDSVSPVISQDGRYVCFNTRGNRFGVRVA